jgi:hypothetical protein
MKKIAFQIQPDYTFKPFSQEDLETAKNYKIYQNVVGDIKGVKHERSLRQLRTYWRCCEITASNIRMKESDPKWKYWNTKKGVDFQLRVACDFRDKSLTAVRPDGTVQFRYKSISIATCEHAEACGYFKDAFKLMAVIVGCTTDELIKNSCG